MASTNACKIAALQAAPRHLGGKPAHGVHPVIGGKGEMQVTPTGKHHLAGSGRL